MPTMLTNRTDVPLKQRLMELSPELCVFVALDFRDAQVIYTEDDREATVDAIVAEVTEYGREAQLRRSLDRAEALQAGFEALTDPVQP